MALSTFPLLGMDGWVSPHPPPELFPHSKSSDIVLNIYFFFIKWGKLACFLSPSLGGHKREANNCFGVLSSPCALGRHFLQAPGQLMKSASGLHVADEEAGAGQGHTAGVGLSPEKVLFQVALGSYPLTPVQVRAQSTSLSWPSLFPKPSAKLGPKQGTLEGSGFPASPPLTHGSSSPLPCPHFIIAELFPTSADACATSPPVPFLGLACGKTNYARPPSSRGLSHFPGLAEPWLVLESLFPLSPSPVGAVSTCCSPQTPDTGMGLSGPHCSFQVSILPLSAEQNPSPEAWMDTPPPLGAITCSFHPACSPPHPVAPTPQGSLTVPAPPTECVFSPLHPLLPRA